MKKLILLFALFSACSTTTVEETEIESLAGEGLQGQWNTGGTLEGDFEWFSSYTFYEHEYYLSGYPPINEKGEYSVDAQGENVYKLTLSPEDGAAFQLTATLAEGGKTLEINGQTYVRVK